MKKIESKAISGIFTPDQRNELPESPGVYLYKNKDNQIIYIGKAKNIKKRVSSYFSKTHLYLKTHLLVQNIHIIDIILVENEQEALLLEATLIKKHLPKYNIDFKDGKFYPYIKVIKKEKFPRIIMTRNKIDDKNLYFGPYVSAGTVRANLELIHKIFQIRTCKTLPKKECIEYHIGRCSAPCIGKIDEKGYRDSVNKAIKFLSGKKDSLIKLLETKMKEASSELLFEKAQIYKEQLDALLALDNNQHIYVSLKGKTDIIGIQEQGSNIGIALSLMRNGRLTGKQGFTVKNTENFPLVQILEEFLISHYVDLEVEELPDKIIIDDEFAGSCEGLTEWFANNETPITVETPSHEDEKALASLAEKNAMLHLERIVSQPDLLETLSSLQEKLQLKNFPSIIDGFDVAKLDGTLASGVAVRFQGGEPFKEGYRMFNVRAENQQDDFIAMEEIVTRHCKNLIENDEALPQLILIDGGKGQLSSALKALKALDLDEEIDLISIAKKEEEIFKAHQKFGTILPSNSDVLHLLQRVRDESHRFSQVHLHRRMDKKLKQ
ncbi:MAG: excinuclease ABC subunit UvrC [Brevinema sp.]